VAHQGRFCKLVIHAGAAQAVFQLLLVAGLQWTTAGNSAILLATAPLLLTVWLVCRGQEYPGRRQWYGLVLGFVGVSLINKLPRSKLRGIKRKKTLPRCEASFGESHPARDSRERLGGHVVASRR
jgi:hypothetical protein